MQLIKLNDEKIEKIQFNEKKTKNESSRWKKNFLVIKTNKFKNKTEEFDKIVQGIFFLSKLKHKRQNWILKQNEEEKKLRKIPKKRSKNK